MKKPNYNLSVEVRFSAGRPWWLSMPRPGGLFERADYGIAFIAGLAAFWLYLRTLGPTITGEDSGEFVTAAYTLGIPHPPGYPLYCLVGHLFTKLPWGEVAWRVNLMSACFGAGAVFLLALLVVYLTRNRFAALMAALALACSREFWAQSVIAEVYSMNAFFFVLCLLLLLLWGNIKLKRYLFMFAFLFGLGVTVHYTFVLLAPLFALYIFCMNIAAPPADKLRWKTYLLLALATTLGLLVFLYLPVRSRANPPIDWGNPETLQNFVDVIRRKQFQFMFSQYPRSFERFVGQMAVSGRFWLGEFMPWGALFGLGGLLVLLRRHFAHGALLLASGLIVVVGFTYWQNFEQIRMWLWVMRVFAIPAYMVTAVGIGVAIEALWRRSGAHAAVAVIVALSCLLGCLYTHWRRNDKSDYYWTRDYGMNILESLEPNAIYVSASDHGSFGVLYLQSVLGMRPDVENLWKFGCLTSPLLNELPAELREKVGEFPARKDEPEIFAWLLNNTDRPMYFANPKPLPGVQGMHYVPAGLVFRALRPDEMPSGRDYWEEYRWHTLSLEETRGDYFADSILYEIGMVKAQAALMMARATPTIPVIEKRRVALPFIEEALTAYGRDPAVLNEAGVLCARYGLYPEAHEYFREALAKLPYFVRAQTNLKKLEAKFLN